MAKPTAASLLKRLKSLGSQAGLDSMARFAIVTDKAFGISVEQIRLVTNETGRDHGLAQELWKTQWYEARLLAAFVDNPAEVTPKQMDAWIVDFDNWAVCDTVCFHLFDRTPHAWKKLSPWSKRKPEFEKRSAFATLWGLCTHDKAAANEPFINSLALIEKCATDERNFVKKAVNMALRAIGKRNAALHSAAIEVAERLAASDNSIARWNGKDALRELRSESVARRLAKKG